MIQSRIVLALDFLGALLYIAAFALIALGFWWAIIWTTWKVVTWIV